VQLVGTAAADFLCSSAALSQNIKSVGYRRPEPLALNRVAFIELGEFVAQYLQPSTHWEQLVEEMTAMLLIDPQAADVGMVKNAGAGALTWQALTSRVQQPVRVLMDYENSRHLWDEYVIDVHGISLLTGKHLSHANELSNWTVDQIAPDR